jgi:hypothetical protein
MDETGRYDGKPLLRLLELYILWAIEELPQSDRQTVEGIAPKLQLLYGGHGEWHDAIASALRMSPEMPEIIRRMWGKNLEIAREKGVSLPPHKFAEMFADQNFAT